MKHTEADDFLRTLRRRVSARLVAHGRTRFGGWRYAIKAGFYLTLYAVAYAALLAVPRDAETSLVFWALVAAAQALVAFNVPHDASHGSAFRSRKLNQLFALGFGVVGLSPYMWHIRHDVAHHAHTNEPGLDPDIDGGPLVRLSPADRWRPIHRFQHLYAPLFYLLTGPLLTMVVDWKWLFDRTFSARLGVSHPRGTVARLFLGKLLFITMMVGVPVAVLPLPAWQVIGGFVLANMAVGLLVALVLLPAHCMEFASFDGAGAPSSPCDADTVARRQLDMTLDYAPRSRLASWLLGGFSTNAIHHLLPGVCHVHHRLLNDVLEDTAREFGATYRHTTLFLAIRSHFRFLARMGAGASPTPSNSKALPDTSEMPGVAPRA